MNVCTRIPPLTGLMSRVALWRCSLAGAICPRTCRCIRHPSWRSTLSLEQAQPQHLAVLSRLGEGHA